VVSVTLVNARPNIDSFCQYTIGAGLSMESVNAY